MFKRMDVVDTVHIYNFEKLVDIIQKIALASHVPIDQSFSLKQ